MSDDDQLDYIVLHRPTTSAYADPPTAWLTRAANEDDAEDACTEAHPGTEVLWVYEGCDVEAAFEDYFSTTMEEEPNPTLTTPKLKI